MHTHTESQIRQARLCSAVSAPSPNAWLLRPGFPVPATLAAPAPPILLPVLHPFQVLLPTSSSPGSPPLPPTSSPPTHLPLTPSLTLTVPGIMVNPLLTPCPIRPASPFQGSPLTPQFPDAGSYLPYPPPLPIQAITLTADCPSCISYPSLP